MLRRTLLVCGIASSLLYVAMNVFVAMQAPTRVLWTTLAAFYTVLVTAFGWGVWKSAGESRALRNVGRLVVAYGALGLVPWIGVWERINIGVFLLWVAVLAVALWNGRDALVASGLPDRRAFKTLEGEAAYLAAYAAAMKFWPVPYDEREIPSRFGRTHVIVSGPKGAPALVLLHGYWATLTMWSLNVADLSRDHRVYAIDIMGQPGRSIPGDPIRSAAEYVEWFTATLDGLDLDHICLVGMSYGAWLGLSFAAAAPERVRKLVLLSPAASLLPLVRQFLLRGTLMLLCPTRMTVRWFMRWLGTRDIRKHTEVDRLNDALVDLMWLGLKHYRFQPETVRIVPTVFTDGALRAMVVPTLLLVGDREVIYDAEQAVARARRLILGSEAQLVPGASHDMTLVQHRFVDARILEFLDDCRTGLSLKAS